jgi:hypothetical protein
MNAMLKAIAQRRTASLKPVSMSTPKRLSAMELVRVAGGAPKGTWSSAESARSPMAPKGTW